MATKFLSTVERALERDRDRIKLPPRILDEVLADAHRWVGETLLDEGSPREARWHLLQSLRIKPRQPRLSGLYLSAFLPKTARRQIGGVYRRIKRSFA